MLLFVASFASRLATPTDCTLSDQILTVASPLFVFLNLKLCKASSRLGPFYLVLWKVS